MSDGCIVRRHTWLMVVFALLVGLVLPIDGFAPQPAGAASTGVSAPWLHVQLVHQDDALPKQPVRSGLVPMGSRSGFLAATRAAMALSVAAEGGAAAASEVPESAQQVLDYVETHNGEAPPGYVGGRPFGNYEGNLPAYDSEGNPISYREYDVNPYQQGVNRGAERIVVGSNGSAFYTNDHYTTFVSIP